MTIIQHSIDYDCAIKIDPNYTDAWLGRGNFFIYIKRYNEALAAYERGTCAQT